MTADSKTTVRDVGKQQSGFRLQRLRAVEYLFDSAENNERALVYVAVETGDDVNHVASNSDGTVRNFEQDKEYDPATRFSFNSTEVLKAMSNFIVCWSDKDFSPNVHFGFYSTNRIGKERETQAWQELSLSAPEKPVLEILKEKNYTPDSPVIDTISSLLLKFIEIEKCLETPLLESIKQWDRKHWYDFLNRIQFSFEAGDTGEVEKRLLDRIKNSKFYIGRSHQNREPIILSRLLDLIDQRQSNQLPAERFVYGADLKNVFYEVASGENRIDDPTWNMWQQLPPLRDQRGLQEKTSSVCPEITPKKLGSFARKAAAGLLLVQGSKADKRMLAVRYRVYDFCKDKLDSFVDQGLQASVEDLENLINELVRLSFENLAELSRTYSYPQVSNSTVKEIVLELVDSCFLAFDESEDAANG